MQTYHAQQSETFALFAKSNAWNVNSKRKRRKSELSMTFDFRVVDDMRSDDLYILFNRIAHMALKHVRKHRIKSVFR